MKQIIAFIIATGIGLWVGGLFHLLSRRLVPDRISAPHTSMPYRLASGFVLGMMVVYVDYSVEWLIALPFAAALVTISFCDFQHKIIPDIITIPGIVLMAVLRFWIHPLPYWDYVGAALVGSGIFYLIALISTAVSKSDSIGGGDIKLLALTGFVLGFKLSLLAFILFCFLGTIVGFLILLTGRFRKDLIIPFGPFIAVASFVCYLWGNDFQSWMIAKLIL